MGSTGCCSTHRAVGLVSLPRYGTTTHRKGIRKVVQVGEKKKEKRRNGKGTGAGKGYSFSAAEKDMCICVRWANRNVEVALATAN